MTNVIPWGPIGELVFNRTYARKLGNRKETLEETVDRIIEGCKKQLGIEWDETRWQSFKRQHLSLEGVVAGRFFWQLGTNTVTKLGLASLQNCAATIVDHPIRPFTWTMDMLMLGSGVGYNIQREFVYEIPKVMKGPAKRAVRKDVKDADFIVPDSREGWVELLQKTLEAYFYTGKTFTYSTICIRSKGAPIKSFGGEASGPEELCQGIEWICGVLDARRNKKLRPIDCLDIMNILGYIVVAGNVRRSAQIAIGDYDDIQFLSAKRWDKGVPNWRAMSNNSVVCNDIASLPDEFWKGYDGGGEPYGLINLALARKVGRLGETQYPDKYVMIFNPCAEQGLAPYETCCLAEIYLPNIKSEKRLWEVTSNLYEVCKQSLALPCHHAETESIVHENMRMGIGVTGYLQTTSEQKAWLAPLYKKLREYDEHYSNQHNLPPSVKLTTVKPSGTLSLLAGVTPGAHPGFSHYHIRRVRIASNSELIEWCQKAGYPIEPQLNFDGSVDHNTMVVSFPCSFPEHTTVADDMTAIDQLNTVKELQETWSDNSVSCTIYYTLDELPAIKEWLNVNYNNGVKTCSFLLKQEHGFKQAPLEKITKEQYDTMVASLSSAGAVVVGEEEMELKECEGGACPVK